jgi:HlyD family secretion protein
MKTIVKMIALVTSIAFVACSRNAEETKPTYKPLIEAVYASGFVVSKDEYEVVSQTEGYLSRKLVEDGTEVKKGDPLFVIDKGQQDARYDIARETYRLAAINSEDDSPVLRELAAAMNNAKSKLEFDSINFVRYENLLKKNATSKSEFDRIRLQYENSANEFALQKSRYLQTKNQLQLELENAKNQLIIAGDETGRYTLKSDIAGIVYMTAKDEGELVKRNETLAVVGKKDGYYLELTVDELDIQRIKKGQEVLVKIDAYPNDVFHAVISQVYPLVDRKQQSVKVDAELRDSLPGAFSGLALEANIIVQKKERALVIPKTKLLPGDSVMIQTPDGDKKVKVTTGIETLDEIEIVKGIDADDLLVSNN